MPTLHPMEQDMCILWNSFPDDQVSLLNYAHNKGAIIMASAGGATEPIQNIMNISNYGTIVAKWVVDHNLDGIDFDIENFSNTDTDFINEINFTSSISKQARDYFKNYNRKYYISHAPQAPYFGPILDESSIDTTTYWTGKIGGYTKIYKDNQDIDFFNNECIIFYLIVNLHVCSILYF